MLNGLAHCIDFCIWTALSAGIAKAFASQLGRISRARHRPESVRHTMPRAGRRWWSTRHLVISGIQEDVQVGRRGEGAAAERGHLVIQVGADPVNFARTNAPDDAEGPLSTAA